MDDFYGIIKICGITNKADAKIAYESGAYSWFVFYEKVKKNRLK